MKRCDLVIGALYLVRLGVAWGGKDHIECVYEYTGLDLIRTQKAFDALTKEMAEICKAAGYARIGGNYGVSFDPTIDMPKVIRRFDVHNTGIMRFKRYG